MVRRNVYQVVVVGQFAIVLAATIGLLLDRLGGWQSKLFAIPYFFLMVNIAALFSLCNTLTGRRIQKWEPERHGLPTDSNSSNVNQSVAS